MKNLQINFLLSFMREIAQQLDSHKFTEYR